MTDKGSAFLFDLDGTLSTQEIIPCLSSELGIRNEMATLTRATLEGMIPFEDSFRLRCLILSKIQLSVVHKIIMSIPLDHYMVDFIKLNQDRCFVVTGNLNIWVQPIIDMLGCGFFSSEGIYQDDSLVLNKVLYKSEAVKAIRAEGFSKVVSVGDSHNDVPMFIESDVAIAFGGVHSPIRKAIEVADFVVHEGRALCQLLSSM
jgi:HAD superfamily phosphoserine phosphatase-like hydrolase